MCQIIIIIIIIIIVDNCRGKLIFTSTLPNQIKDYLEENFNPKSNYLYV